MSERERGSSAIAAINVTPFVDVSLVLLIIFMVVMPTLNERVQLPATADPLRLAEMASPWRSWSMQTERCISAAWPCDATW